MPDHALFERHAQHRLPVRRRLQFRQAGQHVVEPSHVVSGSVPCTRIGALRRSVLAVKVA